MISADEILALYTEREMAYGGMKGRMRSILQHYQGDVIVPLPELDSNEAPGVANLIQIGLDQTAMRVASTVPSLTHFPATNSDLSRKRARTRQQVNRNWWHQSKVFSRQIPKRARHMIGYSFSVCDVYWDAEKEIPAWRVRDPMGTYPSKLTGPDDITPANVIFATERELGWVRRFYPDQWLKFTAGLTNLEEMDDRPITMIEYVDADERVLVAVSNSSPISSYWDATISHSETMIQELHRTPNRAGMVPVTVSERIGLGEEPVGQFDQIRGMFHMQAMLMSLEIIAARKGVFADTWVVSRPGERATIVNPADGMQGQIGEVQGGDIREIQTAPGFMTNPVVDRLERAMRLTSAIPPEYGGESGSNIRTGRRGEFVLGAAIDFHIQEAQRTFADCLEYENRVAVNTAKGWAGSKQFSMYVTEGRNKGPLDYVPDRDFESDLNKVSYSYAGSDQNAMVISAAQRINMGTMSRRNFMDIDPMIEDPETEHDAVIAEGIELALMQSIQQQAAQGAIPPADVARIMELVRTDRMDLAEAVTKAQEEAQERQAQQVEATAPEAMPGLAQPGMGAEAMAPPPEPQGPPDLAQLLGSL